jgi:hypothetical protein
MNDYLVTNAHPNAYFSKLRVRSLLSKLHKNHASFSFRRAKFALFFFGTVILNSLAGKD